MITCPKCQHAEYDGEVICSKCGTLLVSPPKVNTKSLSPQELESKTKPLPDTEAAMPIASGQVALIVQDQTEPIVLEGHEEYILGRQNPAEPPTSETIDLNPYQGRERGVSRQHATLQVAYQQVLLVDLGSTNGTWVNGTVLAPHQPIRLEDGDEVRLGKLRLRVYFKF